jgi:glycerol-3-phosphate acyltransferase PlsY
VKGRQVAAVAGAFALGTVPTAALVARARGVRIEEVGDRKAGAANVRHTIGLGAGLTVMGLDVAKGYVPAAVGRRLGAGPHEVGMLAVAPIGAHILFTGGRGAATSLGSAFALDATAMTLAGSGIIAGTIAGKHPQAVISGAFAFALLIAVMRRSPKRTLWGAVVVLLMVAARLRGPAGTPWPPPKQVLWARFLRDRDT